MAQRARLSAPHSEPQQEWPWHQLKWTSLSADLLCSSDRRMEAENYLSSGRGVRLAIESRPGGWRPFVEVANVWQPSRLKGIQVSLEFGTPFLPATQIFDIRPMPRKWLAVERTSDAANRFINSGAIVVTCSGAVGRATLAYAPHEKTLISHDLLRIEARDAMQWGWIYAYLRSPQARAMMTGAKYGHIIKHLEISHLNALPLPIVNDEHAREFHVQTAAILDLRSRAYRLTLEAEERFESALGSFKVTDWGESGFTVSAAEAFSRGRRRLEGSFHNPAVAAICSHLMKHGRGFTTLPESGFDAWLPNRFKRIPATDGIELVESSAVFETSPDFDKRVAEVDFGDAYQGRVKAGWLLMARSGQVYGLNGSVALATSLYENKVVSDDLIRIAPKTDAALRVGYLYIALSHPVLGRPLVKALAYGSSIPHIDVSDLMALGIVRLASKEEEAIADLAEEATELRARADEREKALADEASRLIDRFMAGKTEDFIMLGPSRGRTEQ